jgi:effector-binding domain-containing protein
MNYDVHVKQAPPETVVTKRTHTTLGELGSTMHATLASIAESVQPRDAARGVPFAIYHNEPFRPDDIDVEMGLPLTADGHVAPSAGSPHTLHGGPVAYTTHVGPYTSIGSAYGALYEWLRSHGYRPHGPPREIYLVGPGQTPNAMDYRTEIDVPIEIE